MLSLYLLSMVLDGVGVFNGGTSFLFTLFCIVYLKRRDC